MTESVHNSIYKLETGKWERVGDLTVSINMCLSINFQIVHIEHGVCEARQKNQVSIDTADYIKKNFLKNI